MIGNVVSDEYLGRKYAGKATIRVEEHPELKQIYDKVEDIWKKIKMKYSMRLDEDKNV